jgi:pimeloyl-ACP methyl ester carboxylesterase
MKNIFVFISLFCVLELTAQNDNDRVVFWLHGLGGNDAAFTKVVEATTFTGAPGYPERRIGSVQLGYQNHTFSLGSAGAFVESQIRVNDAASSSFGLGFNNNFIIAHSQGGLVARVVDKMYSDFSWLGRRINGLVTFGTPHQGARILDNIGNFNTFISSGCSDLSAGVLEEAIPNGFLIDLIIPNGIVSAVTQPICALAGEAAPLAFSDFTQPITEDYKINTTTPILAQLNSFQSNIPKVAFYGVEDQSTMLWRILFNVKDQLPNAFPAFGADDDNKLVNAANSNLLKYQTKATFWQNQWSSLASNYCNGWQWFFAPVYCIFNDGNVNSDRNKAILNRDAWQKGANWWATANDKFSTTIGALDFQEVQSTAFECNCESYDYDGNTVSQWTEFSDSPNCPNYGPFSGCNFTGNTDIQTTFIPITKESDGIVLRESAENFPGAASIGRMEGSNHQQMRNDSNTKQKLLELWGGTHGSFFITGTR